jgi:nucleotide-binding universal stress UspA family protein
MNENREPFSPSRILCPVDFSEPSDRALKYAAFGARAFKSRLTVFHAQRFELPAYFTNSQFAELIRQQKGDLARAKERLRLHVKQVLGPAAQTLRLSYEVAEAHPVDAILEAAESQRSELLVMGTHGRGGAKRVWLGSVAESVMRQVRVPVFAVRQKRPEFVDVSSPQAPPEFKTILCPLNLSEAARQALELAASLARRFQSRLVTACVLEPNQPDGRQELERKLQPWLNESGAARCKLESLVRHGQAGEAIRALATETGADLIVLGAQNPSAVQTWSWGETTEFVVRHAPVPVLVVPMAGQTARPRNQLPEPLSQQC